MCNSAPASTAQGVSTCGGSPEEFIDKIEIARRLHKHVRTVDNWMARGILPYYKLGRSVVFLWSEIKADLKANNRVSLLRGV